MLLELFGFLQLSLADILDICMVAFIIYLGFKWIKDSSAANIFLALLMLFVIQVVVTALNMKMMSALMNTLLDVGVLALIIIFQPEIRHFLTRLGINYRFASKGGAFINRLLGIKEERIDSGSVNEITEACRAMSAEKTGALIVLTGKMSLSYIIETGDRIDADIHRRLIRNLFFKNSPLHDGAVVIRGNRIAAARCTLPITERTDIPAHFGMRHKAAIGISEESDASVIVVSEETGRIVFVQGGAVTEIGNINELKLKLGQMAAHAQNGEGAKQSQQ